jgi:hypothetical protein
MAPRCPRGAEAGPADETWPTATWLLHASAAVTRARLPFRFEPSRRWSGSRWTPAIEMLRPGRAASCAAGLVGCRTSLNVALEVFAPTCNEIRLSPSLGQMNREEDGERMRLSWR